MQILVLRLFVGHFGWATIRRRIQYLFTKCPVIRLNPPKNNLTRFPSNTHQQITARNLKWCRHSIWRKFRFNEIHIPSANQYPLYVIGLGCGLSSNVYFTNFSTILLNIFVRKRNSNLLTLCYFDNIQSVQ